MEINSDPSRWHFFCARRRAARKAAPPSLDNSRRIRDLLRAGTLYLSLEDALALAIENNLDVELQRAGLRQGETELRRAQGGGVVRGLGYTLAEAPAGVGGPVSPLVTNRAVAGNATNGTTVAANALELGALGAPLVNYSVQGSVPQSSGTAVPVLDPSVTGLWNWSHQTTPETSFQSYDANTLVANAVQANAGVQQGFSTGAQAALSFNNLHQSLNSLTTGYNPFTGSSLAFTVTQPLLRGFGVGLNRRYIRIAANERRIASLLFQQQLILTVYGVIRLYTDFVALYEDVKVKQEAVALAEKLLSDTRAQVDEGALAPIELSARQRPALFDAPGPDQLARPAARAGSHPEKRADARRGPRRAIGARDPDRHPDHPRPGRSAADPGPGGRCAGASSRPEPGNAAGGQLEHRAGGRPQRHAAGGRPGGHVLQNNGLAGPRTGYVVNPNPSFVGGYGSVLGQILAHDYPTYGIGLQVTLPIHNRIAESDLARDELQVKQSEIRVRQLQNQARLEVEDAVIAMRRARASYEAAVEARKYQQESLEAEQTKFEAGASTVFFVNQYENQVAQAKSAEVVARSSYVKAKAALQRATGTILDENRVEVEAAVKGTVR